jgi:glycosyltransferase involved in cell wall biosynthesis
MKFQSNSVLSNPTVSIVVPNYNHAPFLEKRLDTIFNQTFQNFEVILLDDGSTDNSLEILRSYCNHPKVSHCIFDKQNSGLPFKQWQKGIQLAKGKYIWIAESDDWAEEDFLEKLVPQLNEETGIAFCKSHTFIDSKKELSSYYFPEDLYPASWNESVLFDGHDLLKNYHAQINTIPNASACLFRKDLAQFDDVLSGMKFCGDWLFWARLMNQTDVYFLAEKLNYWRSSEQTIRNWKGNRAEQKRYIECIACLKEIRELFENDRIKLKDYDWLFLNHFSSKSIWSLPFQKKPDIPVSKLRFKMYLLRSSTNLLFKKCLKKIFGKKKE